MHRTCLIGLLWIVGCLAAAADPAVSDQDQEIGKLVKQLDDDQYGVRQAAAARLKTAGKKAIPALKKAASGESLEATCRAVDILHKFYESDDAATKEAAKKALDELAKGDHPSASARAAAALKPKPDPAAATSGPAPIILPGGGQIIVQGINVMPGGANVRRFTSHTVNGAREVEAEENGRKVKIVQDPAGAIKMEITADKNGKPATDKYEAKNAEELKKKHPQAHAIYQQYINQNPAAAAQAQIQVQFGIGGNALPVPLPVMPANNNRADHAARLLKSWSTVLPGMTGTEQLRTASKESREDLKKQTADLKKQLAELEKRLSDAEKP